MKTEVNSLQINETQPGADPSWPRIETEGGIFYALVNLGPFSQARIALHGIGSQSEALQAARMLQFAKPAASARKFVQN